MIPLLKVLILIVFTQQACVPSTGSLPSRGWRKFSITATLVHPSPVGSTKKLNLLNARPQLLKPTSTKIDEDQDGSIRSTKSVEFVTKDIISNSNKNKSMDIFRQAKRRGALSFPEEIVFPDSYENEFDALPRIQNSPVCAKGNTFCENFDRYPYGHVKQVLQRNPIYKELFGKDEAPEEISNRNGNDEMFVCNSMDRTIFPKIGKTKNNKWKYIINQGDEDGFVQGVRVEVCRSHGKPCEIIGELPNGYITLCKQKYVYRRLLSLSETGVPTPDSFQLPSACCCAYKRNIEFLARFGAPVTPAKSRR